MDWHKGKATLILMLISVDLIFRIHALALNFQQFL